MLNFKKRKTEAEYLIANAIDYFFYPPSNDIAPCCIQIQCEGNLQSQPKFN